MPAKTRFTSDHDLFNNLAKLKINDVCPEDAGAYTCIAENTAGTDITTADVFVIKMPDVDQKPIFNPENFKNLAKPNDLPIDLTENVDYFFPPKVIIPLKNIKAKEGTNTMLACKIVGHPKPEV